MIFNLNCNMICNTEFDLNCNRNDNQLPNVTLVFEPFPYVDDMKDWQLVFNDFTQFPSKLTDSEKVESLKPAEGENRTTDALEEIKQEELDIKEEFNNTETNEQRGASLISKFISQPSSQNENAEKLDQMFECAHCGYKTTSKSTLKSHIKIHSSVKPFVCDICGYRTVDKSNLRAHLKIHTGERPHKCTFCPYKTTLKFVLKQHVTIHTGEKLFKCELCDFGTGFRSSITLHMSTHTGLKPFLCTVCNFRSAAKQGLKEHVRVHTGEKPFPCSKCEYRASKRYSLKRHIKNRHMSDAKT